MREHLQRLSANTGKVDPRLNIEWPAIGSFVWWAFNTMSRPSSGFGISPIPSSEIVAWQILHGIRLTPWELEMIAVFDSLAIKHARAQEARKTAQSDGVSE